MRAMICIAPVSAGLGLRALPGEARRRALALEEVVAGVRARGREEDVEVVGVRARRGELAEVERAARRAGERARVERRPGAVSVLVDLQRQRRAERAGDRAVEREVAVDRA